MVIAIVRAQPSATAILRVADDATGADTFQIAVFGTGKGCWLGETSTRECVRQDGP
jgi:hypothetical protein